MTNKTTYLAPPYVYRIDHPISGEFYVGYRKANKLPAIEDFGHVYKTSSKLLTHPFDEYTHMLLAEFFTETASEDAYDFEQLTIFENWNNPSLANKSCFHGKGRFRNNGHSQETRQKIKEARKNQSPFTDATRQKIKEARKNQSPFTDATRQKMSDANKRRPPITEETRQKLRDGHKNMSAEIKQKLKLKQANRPPITEETRKKLSDSAIGRVRSAESIRKTTEANTGRKDSPETCLAKSIAGKNRFKNSGGHSEETIQKMCKSQSNRSEVTLARMRAAQKIDHL